MALSLKITDPDMLALAGAATDGNSYSGWAPAYVPTQADIMASNNDVGSSGWFNWDQVPVDTSAFYTPATGGGDSSNPSSFNNDAYHQWMKQNGYSLQQFNAGDNTAYMALVDKAGNVVGDVQKNKWNDDQFGAAMLAAAALTGAMVAPWAAAGGAAQGTGTLGSGLLSTPAMGTPLPGTVMTAPTMPALSATPGVSGGIGTLGSGLAATPALGTALPGTVITAPSLPAIGATPSIGGIGTLGGGLAASPGMGTPITGGAITAPTMPALGPTVTVPGLGAVGGSLIDNIVDSVTKDPLKPIVTIGGAIGGAAGGNDDDEPTTNPGPVLPPVDVTLNRPDVVVSDRRIKPPTIGDIMAQKYSGAARYLG